MYNPWKGVCVRARKRERESVCVTGGGKERGRVGEKLDEIPLPLFFFFI